MAEEQPAVRRDDRVLVSLEEQGWEALSSTAERAARFYGEVLDRDVVMLLPGGMVLDDRSAIVKSMSGRPWSSYRMHDVRVLWLTDDTAVVAYGVDAERAGSPPYSALMSSTYVRREDGWKLAFHQQTPR